ncbi:Aldehyde oxidase GLOX [Psilocybe cubensis]|uniref:Copper radical oxidase n=2 Tax=Psilocybe cubensis TaxID=181762 RepID=A0A8H7Y2L5_PSICU|nr:Aldehyde oxidase GLOX [Psilocybe cubensis]KAH9483904.1 Aldehyde oxidase GLOX [Psilocybe cubensis]
MRIIATCCRLYIQVIIIGLFLSGSAKVIRSESAWNGRVTPESTKLAPFTPYYVPPGAKSYDSTSPFISYKGVWSDHYSTSYVGKSLRSTSDPGAEVVMTFTGTGIEWFGNMDQTHGVALVMIDGQTVGEVNTYINQTIPLKQQRLFSKFNMKPISHTLKIINLAKRPGSIRKTVIDVDAFVVTRGYAIRSTTSRRFSSNDSTRVDSNAMPRAIPEWTLIQNGSTGVHAMQLSIVSDTHALIIDKVEHNPVSIDGHPAWAALYNLVDHSVTPLRMQSNSFCAGGTFLGNGTLINVGGNPVVETHTSAADFGDLNGLQAIRIFEPCDSSTATCVIYENHSRIRMASPRWYNTVIRLADGSAMIIGGARKGGWINNATVNNPTVEYFPPKNIKGSNGMPINLSLLINSLRSNLFPIAFVLPDGKVFIAANRDVVIYDWQADTERYLPQIPNGVRVTYPMAGTALLLPLSPENGYVPEVLICGGSTVDDAKPGYELSSQDPSSSQCSRMVLDDDGIEAGWQTEDMPDARLMPDAVLLPTGKIVIVNGAGSGISGYGNVVDQIGASNADNPIFMPVLYDPLAPVGGRFSSNGLPTSSIPRLYHSVATLTPVGNIMIAGSNPNLDRSEIKYGTEYRVEWLNPPYIFMDRPMITSFDIKIPFGASVNVEALLPGNHNDNIQFALMDLGFVTHAVHANSRLVYLLFSYQNGVFAIQGPPSGNVYPPGPAWLYIVVDGVPSEGRKVMVGDGGGPPVDENATQNVLSNTAVDQHESSQVEGDASE